MGSGAATGRCVTGWQPLARLLMRPDENTEFPVRSTLWIGGILAQAFLQGRSLNSEYVSRRMSVVTSTVKRIVTDDSMKVGS